MPLEDDTRRQLAALGQLWGLAAVCATAGAVVVARTGRLVPGIFAFLAALAVFGPFLWRYERRRRRPAQTTVAAGRRLERTPRPTPSAASTVSAHEGKNGRRSGARRPRHPPRSRRAGRR